MDLFGVGAIIDALLARRSEPAPDEWLFVMQDGTQIDNLRDQFDRVLSLLATSFPVRQIHHQLLLKLQAFRSWIEG